MGQYNPQGGNYNQYGTPVSGTSGPFSENTIDTTYTPELDANSYQYGGKPGAATSLADSVMGYGKSALSQQAPREGYADAQNFQGGYNAAAGDLAGYAQTAGQFGALAGRQGQLADYYQGVAQGTAPSLAQAQLHQATDQNVASQFALANSAKGGLGAAGAQLAAQTNAAQAAQQNAQASVAANIQQQQVGAAGLAGALSGQGAALGGQASAQNAGTQAALGVAGAGLGEQNLEQGVLGNQAQLDMGQRQLANNAYLGAGSLANNIYGTQLQGQEAYGSQFSSNQLAGQQQTNQSNQFNATQNQHNVDQGENAIGGILKGLGGALGFDADLVEPNKPADDAAHWTLREEPSFILAKNQLTGELRKVATEPLTESERRQAVDRPHGAGPLGAVDPRRLRMTYNDVQLSDSMAGGDWGDRTYESPVPASRRQFPGQTMVHHYTDASKIRPSTTAEGYAALHQAAYPSVFHDLDLGGGRRRVYHDAQLSDYGPEGGGSGSGSGGPPLVTVPLSAVSPQALAAIGSGSGGGMVSGSGSGGVASSGSGLPSASVQAGPIPGDDTLTIPPVTIAGGRGGSQQVTFRSAPAAGQGGAGGASPSMLAGALGPPSAAREVPLIDPKRASDIAAANAEQVDAAQRQGHAEAETERGNAQAAGLRGAELGNQAEAMQYRARQQNEETRDLETRINKYSEDVANAKEDPDRWWNGQSTGDKIRYGIAAALGGLGSALSHTPDSSMDQINRHIDNDLKAQRNEIERKKGRIGDMQGLLASAYRRFGNMDQAEAAARAAALGQIDEEAKSYAAGSNSQAVLAKYQGLSAALREKAAREQAQLFRYIPAGAGGGSNLAADYRKYADDWLKGDQKVAKLDFNHWLLQRSGASGDAAPQAGGGKGASRLLRNVPTLQANVDQLKRLEALESQRYMSADQKAEAAAIRRQLGPDAPPDVSWTDRAVLGEGGTAARATRGAQAAKLGRTLDVIRSGAGDAGDDEPDDDVENLVQ